MKKALLLFLCVILVCLLLSSCYQFTSDFLVETDRITYAAVHNDLEECFLTRITVHLTEADLPPSPDGIRRYTVVLPESLFCEHCGKVYRVSAMGGFRGSGAPVSPTLSVLLDQPLRENTFYHFTLQLNSADLPRGSDWMIREVLDLNGAPLPDEAYTFSYAISDPHPTLRLGEDGQVYPLNDLFFIHVKAGAELLTQSPDPQGYGYGETVTLKVRRFPEGTPTVLRNGVSLSPAREESDGAVYEFSVTQESNDLFVYAPNERCNGTQWLLSEYERLHPNADAPTVRRDYSRHNACWIAMIDSGDYTANLWAEQVAGSTFQYGDGNRILVYRYGEFFTLTVAHALGFLSAEEVATVAALHRGNTAP